MLRRVLLLSLAMSMLSVISGSAPALAWCRDAAGTSYRDAPGNATSLCNIPLGVQSGDSINQNDVDWFRFQGTAGTAYRVHALLGGSGDLRLSVLNSSGTELFFNDDGSSFTKNPVLGFVAPYTGLYFAKVTLGPFSGSTGYTIVRTLRSPDPICPTGTIAGFNRGQEFTGAITSGGTLTYCFGAAAGSYFAFTLWARPGAVDPLQHRGWLLRNASTGGVLTFRTDVTGTGRIPYGQFPSTGTYLLQISGNRLLDPTGEYLLRRLE